MRNRLLTLVAFMLSVVGEFLSPAPANSAPGDFAEIRVVDAETKRGIPLIELITVNEIRFVTDNTGRIAFQEPGLMGKEIFFSINGHGYDAPKDAFGIAGIRITPKAGEKLEIPLKRSSVAQRLARLTGEGLYRDTRLLGLPVPIAESKNPGLVVGQDSVQSAVYKGKAYWFWGDTNQMRYLLGLYRVAGATSEIPKGDISHGIAYDYFCNSEGFARAMMPLAERPEGVVWIFGVCVVNDRSGAEKMIGHYSRRKGLADELEHGIAVFDDETSTFKILKQLPLEEKWRFPIGHPIVHEADGKRWLMFGDAFPNIRVPADLESILDPKQYEAFSYSGTPATWAWRKDVPPTDSKIEGGLLKSKKIKPETTYFSPSETGGETRITLHTGSVRWNEYRKKWIFLGNRFGAPNSFLGEVWYSEADLPNGPFNKAVRVAVHDKQTFYNVAHFPILDRDGGKTIHFEGTYTNEFSGNPEKTARYNYNQILYRLDLSDERVKTMSK